MLEATVEVPVPTVIVSPVFSIINVSLPAPPINVSAPPAPSSVSFLAFAVITLANEFPTALVAVVPVKVKFMLDTASANV